MIMVEWYAGLPFLKGFYGKKISLFFQKFVKYKSLSKSHTVIPLLTFCLNHTILNKH